MMASRSIRCDFIMNLDPFMRRAEVVGKVGVGATTTTAGGGEDERRAPSLLLPHPPPSAPTVAKSIVRSRRTIEGDDRSSSGSSSGANDGVVGAAGGANRGKKDGGGPTVIGGGVAGGGGGGGGGRRLITREDDPSIRTYPLRVVDQLRLCERKANKGERDDNSRIAIATVVGFECIHCRRVSAGAGARQAAERFRRFPKTHQEVSIELSSFRTHLSTCRGVPSDLRSYLSWMERRWWPSQRLQRTAPAIAAHIMRRLDAHDRSDGADQNAAPPSANKINESTKRDNDTRKRARELVELTKLERTKRINVNKRRNHSVLEDVGSLA